MTIDTGGRTAAARAGDAAPVDSARPDTGGNVIPFGAPRGSGNLANPGFRMMLVMAMAGLTGLQRQVLAVLAFHCARPWGCWAALETLCCECGGLSRPHLCRTLSQLETAGHIQRRRSPGRRRTHYHLPFLFEGGNSAQGGTVEADTEAESNSAPEGTVNSAQGGTVNSALEGTQKELKGNSEGKDRSVRARTPVPAREAGASPTAVDQSSSVVPDCAPCGVAPVGAGSSAEDMTESVSLKRVEAWNAAGRPHCAGLDPARAERIAGLSDADWTALLAYVETNEHLRTRSLAYLTAQAEPFKATARFAKEAASGGPAGTDDSGDPVSDVIGTARGFPASGLYTARGSIANVCALSMAGL